MLNLFAATGHINYAKSARLYLQLMRELPSDYPWLYQCFIEQGFHTVRRSSRYWAGLWTDLIIEQVMMRSIKSRGGLTRGRGVTESVRLQWIYSMHKCAGVHDAMTTSTNLRHRTSEQHVELGTSRCKRDNEDLNKIQNWFDQYEPFNPNQPKLCSLSTGLTAADDNDVNCDQTEVVGNEIHKKLDGISIADASIKRNDQVRSLDCLRPGVQVDKKKMYINPTQLFSRLIAIVQREKDMAPFFSYELTTIPTSLFKENSLRKTDKAQLARTLKTGVEPSAFNAQAKYVLDGGALIHKVKWLKKGTYGDVAKQYVTYVRTKYGKKCCIVFDGYDQGPSIKDSEHHHRRLHCRKTCADILVKDSIEAHANQEVFLTNQGNKAQLITLLSKNLHSDAQSVYNSTGDADVLIVKNALQIAIEGHEVNVVADDTDVLILLMHHWNERMADIYMISEPKKKGLQVWKIRELVAKAGSLVVSNILFIHAWSGCDTTSATFGQGKTNLIKTLKVHQEVQQLSSLFCCPSVTDKEVGEAGCRLFVILYGGKQKDSLNNLRYVKFLDMVSSRKQIDPQKLPPTERAAYYHSLRVHLQVMLWKKLVCDHEDSQMNPQNWGWKIDDKVMSPIMTDIAVAPEALLNLVRCNCKLSSRNPCGSCLCSCRKNGLKCVTACGDCRGENCKNSEKITFLSDSEDEL